MSKIDAIGRRATATFVTLALALAAMVTILVMQSSRASASTGTAYPPPPPSATATTQAPSNSVAPTQATKSADKTSKKQSNNLASTGFDTAGAVILVVLLIGVGGTFLYLGRRGRRA